MVALCYIDPRNAMATGEQQAAEAARAASAAADAAAAEQARREEELREAAGEVVSQSPVTGAQDAQLEQMKAEMDLIKKMNEELRNAMRNRRPTQQQC